MWVLHKRLEFMADKLKFVLALLLLIAGVAGFYLLSAQPMILRVLAVLAGMGGFVAVAWFTESGQRFFDFSREAVAETKKVVWPTRRETMQTTGAVFAFVLVMSIVLWVTDKGLEWVLYDLILGWKKS
jgi:preprotein translocase subunit SecE